MPLKLISVRKGSHITMDGKECERIDIVNISKDWTDVECNIFKKIARQGGTVRIQTVKYVCIPAEQITNSLGVRDGGAPKMFGPEE